jgi:predicted O-methyltransferase YrrM
MIDFTFLGIEEDLLIKDSFIKFKFIIGGETPRTLKFFVFDPFFDIQFIPGEHEDCVPPGESWFVGFEVDYLGKDEKPGVRNGFRIVIKDEENNKIFEEKFLNPNRGFSLRGETIKKVAWIIGDSNVWSSFGNDSHRYTDIGGFFPVRSSVISLSLNRFLKGNYLEFLRTLPIREGDVLIFYLGEIDFRYTIHKASGTKNVPVQELCEQMMQRYFDTLEKIHNVFGIRILVMSPNPPIQDGFLDEFYSPSLGSIEDKKLCFEYFNNFWNSQLKFEYLNWTEDYLEINGLAKTEMFEPQNHHIKVHSPIKKQLEKKLLNMSYQPHNISDPDPKELVDYCLNSDLMEKCIFMQVYEEILSLAYWLKGFRPNNVLEIGTMGSSFWILSKLSTGKKVSVDIEPRQSIIHHFMYGEDWKFFQGDSKTEEIFSAVKDFCPQYDFIFIDGDHSYDGVKGDFNLYKNLLSPRGVIAFHDVDPNHIFADSYGGQVYKFWQDLDEGSKMNLICKKSSGKVKLNGIYSEGFGGIGIWMPS